MRRLASLLLVLALSGAFPPTGNAADHATRQDAQALVDKAIAAFREDGAKKAFAEISNPKGRFVDRDLYVFVYAQDGKIVAHGADRRLIGRKAASFTDVDGKKFGLDIMKATPAGIWVDYKWMNPVTKTVEQKSSFVKKAEGYVFGVGVYEP